MNEFSRQASAARRSIDAANELRIENRKQQQRIKSLEASVRNCKDFRRRDQASHEAVVAKLKEELREQQALLETALRLAQACPTCGRIG